MKYLLSTFFLSLLTILTTIAQPFNHSFHRSAINLGYTLYEGQNDQYLIGGATGQFAGWPNFDGYLMSIDTMGNILWEYTLNGNDFSEIRHINHITYADSIGYYLVSTSETGCDYGTPDGIHMIDSSGILVWSGPMDFIDNGVNKFEYLHDFDLLVQSPNSGTLYNYDILGFLQAEYTLFSDPSITIEDILKTKDPKVALMSRHHVFMTDWSQSTNIVQATASFDEEVLLIDYMETNESMIVVTEERIVRLDGDNLSEQGLSLLGEWGTPVETYCSSDHIYLLMVDYNQYTLVTYDSALNLIEELPLEVTSRASISDFIVKNGQLTCLGNLHSRPAYYTDFVPFYNNRGSDIYIRSWDLDQEIQSAMDVSLSEVTVDDTTVVVAENEFCEYSSLSMNITYSNIRVKITNNGADILNEVALSTANFPCSFFCPATVTNAVYYTGVDLQPGESTVLYFGNHQTYFSPFSSNFSLCIWASSPNGLIDNNLADNLSCLSISVDPVVSTNEVNPDSPEIQVYPNPTTDYLHLRTSMPSFEKVSLSITNMLGNTLMSRHISSFGYEYSLDVHSLPPGVYLLHFNSGARKRSIRWVKK
jgi:hypothetical protein